MPVPWFDVVRFIAPIVILFGIPFTGMVLLRTLPAARPRPTLLGLLFGSVLIQAMIVGTTLLLAFSGPSVSAATMTDWIVINLIAGGGSWLLMLLTAVLSRPRPPGPPSE